MPYIVLEDRTPLERDFLPSSAGELNFAVSALCRDYLGDSYRYADINEVVGALECAKLELYRRIAVPYENTAIEKNGDIY